MESVKTLIPMMKYSWSIYKLFKLQAFTSVTVLRKYSTQNPGTEVTVREKIQLTKPTVTKWKRPPFVKNFFVGKFDTELLTFPEILNNEQLNELENVVKSLNVLYNEKVNSLEIDNTKTIPKELIQELKELGLFGRMIPAKYGGLELTHTACTRLNEVLGLDWSVAMTLASHEFWATQCILFAGTEEQKIKYIPDLASGNRIAALCSSESKSGCDLLVMETSVRESPDGSFILTGNKSWVTNAQSADYFIVLAKINSGNATEGPICCFIVDKNSDGVVVEPYEKTSLQGIETAMVRFKEVHVPSSNMLGNKGSGFQIYLEALDSLRFAISSCTIGTLKSLLESITNYVINTERWEKSLADSQLVQERLTNINNTIYAMESVAYYTAAILDSTADADIAVETNIAKVFNTEGTLYCLRELMQALGSSSFLKEQQLERLYRDAQALAVFEGSNDICRLAIGLTGSKYLGYSKAQEIVKLRNAYFFPKDTVKTIFRHGMVMIGRARYDQDLAGYMHPSLVLSGNRLEQCLQKFEVAMERLFNTYGREVVDAQLDLKRAAAIAIDMYAMTAVISRSSRSYCIGLKNAEHEIRVASTFCNEACDRINFNLKALNIGSSFNNDGNKLLISDEVVKNKGYFAEHPLKLNF